MTYACSCARAGNWDTPKPTIVPPTLVARGAAIHVDVWKNAVVLVDKPEGWSSSDVCGKLRGAFAEKKVPALLMHPNVLPVPRLRVHEGAYIQLCWTTRYCRKKL